MTNDLDVENKIVDEDKLAEFVDYTSKYLKGNERSEAQIFLERLFQAFGHPGIAEVGAVLEDRLRINDKIKFPDLLWPRKVLIEMKSRGEKLQDHFDQAKTYWDNAFKKKTEYVVLCNFDEFWVYNWNEQKDPLDKVPLEKLSEMWRSFPFLCRQKIDPIFGNNFVDVTEKAAEKIAELYRNLVTRGIEEKRAQRFTLQCLVALFAEDTGLFPEQGFFTKLIDSCLKNEYSKELFNSLFTYMNSKESPTEGAFKGVRYFDGGIFSEIDPIDLNNEELKLLYDAALKNWSKVQPSIFGNIFEGSLNQKERHKLGAHYTYESDIMRIVEPTILRQWRGRIESATKSAELRKIWDELSKFRILDPACGSGNFLYVSFRELKSLELLLIKRLLELDRSEKPERLKSKISSTQFFGIEKDPFAVELAKITLSMAKKFAVDEFNNFTRQNRLFLDEVDDPLPFDNLDNNIICGDALLVDWPNVDAIIGNPPFQSKNKMQKEFNDLNYIKTIREMYPEIPGRADYCVYWFRKAHDNLADGGRAGLVGTNTIRQTYSRIGGLDYILSNGGTITEAIATMPWSGEAVVHVSIVNWIKNGKIKMGKKKLALQKGENKSGPWEEYELDEIYSSLSSIDAAKAKPLGANRTPKKCYQGQTHGHKGFLLDFAQWNNLIKIEPEAHEVTFPYLIADDLLGHPLSQPSRFVIDFQQRDIFGSMKYKHSFKIIKDKVLEDRRKASEEEIKRNAGLNLNTRTNKHHQNFYKKWWQLSYQRKKMISELSLVPRYLVCSRITKRPIFEFISSEIRPNDALTVFPLADDYSFGILQSTLHWNWFNIRCSTFKDDPRYTSNTVFDTFPWPQWYIEDWKTLSRKDSKKSALDIALSVAKAGRELRDTRNRIKMETGKSLRDIYRVSELSENNPLAEAQRRLDASVMRAFYYGMPKELIKLDQIEFLFELNKMCHNSEMDGKNIVGPGLPTFCEDRFEFFSDDCIGFIK